MKNIFSVFVCLFALVTVGASEASACDNALVQPLFTSAGVFSSSLFSTPFVAQPLFTSRLVSPLVFTNRGVQRVRTFVAAPQAVVQRQVIARQPLVRRQVVVQRNAVVNGKAAVVQRRAPVRTAVRAVGAAAVNATRPRITVVTPGTLFTF